MVDDPKLHEVSLERQVTANPRLVGHVPSNAIVNGVERAQGRR
jgi:hypothetical protein